MDVSPLPLGQPHAAFNAFADRLGGCYTCRWFGHRVDVAVWCAKPGSEHVRSQAHRGCAFWEREPGADDEVQGTLTGGTMKLLRAISACMLCALPLSPCVLAADTGAMTAGDLQQICLGSDVET